ncbi:MAG TPA: hypothetical protein VF014_16745 [Casimicrobiaceae bacterium]|nr:hypothetical protein [Casimicrobiaceae bacterium]
MRLSRNVIIGVATLSALAVSGALIWALTQNSRKPTNSGELYSPIWASATSRYCISERQASTVLPSCGRESA